MSSTASIRVAQAENGLLTYLVPRSPEALPVVRGRDLERAWEASREAARAALWGEARLFRFQRDDGTHSDLALADPDACCWAAAVDRLAGISNDYGLSLLVRLLALVDLLARAPRLTPLLSLRAGGGADLHPSLLQAAAQARLTAEARFEETGFPADLGRLPEPESPRLGAG